MHASFRRIYGAWLAQHCATAQHRGHPARCYGSRTRRWTENHPKGQSCFPVLLLSSQRCAACPDFRTHDMGATPVLLELCLRLLVIHTSLQISVTLEACFPTETSVYETSLKVMRRLGSTGVQHFLAAHGYSCNVSYH